MSSWNDSDVMQLLAQQDQTITALKQQLSERDSMIQMLSSANSKLESTLKKASSMPAVKQIFEEKERNEKLQKDLSARLSAADEREKAVSLRENNILARESQAEYVTARLQEKENSMNRLIKERAESQIRRQKNDMQRQENAAERRINAEYMAKKTALFAFTSVFSLWGFFVTVLEAVKSPVFRAEVLDFLDSARVCLINPGCLLLALGQDAAALADRIPQPLVAKVLNWFLQIAVIAGLAAALGIFLFISVRFLYLKMKENGVFDQITAFVLMAICGVSIIFADDLAPQLWNIVTVILLESVGYLLGRLLLTGDESQ